MRETTGRRERARSTANLTRTSLPLGVQQLDDGQRVEDVEVVDRDYGEEEIKGAGATVKRCAEDIWRVKKEYG